MGQGWDQCKARLARCPLNRDEISCPLFSSRLLVQDSLGDYWPRDDWQGSVRSGLDASLPSMARDMQSNRFRPTTALDVPSLGWRTFLTRPSPELDFSSSSFFFHLPSAQISVGHQQSTPPNTAAPALDTLQPLQSGSTAAMRHEFKFASGPGPPGAPPVSCSDWEQHKAIIGDLWMTQAVPLKQLVDIMQIEHSFAPS